MSPVPAFSRQRGVALVTSLILLVIITILGLSMFRSFGTQEKIAGNMREKERALHAAESAQQYAEWWLTLGNNAAPGAAVACAGPLSANLGEGQICNVPLATLVPNLTQALPWPNQVTYAPPNMTFGTTVNPLNEPYFRTPAFYISDLGVAADAKGEAYLIDSYGYGGSQGTVSVIESTYEITPGVTCLTC